MITDDGNTVTMNEDINTQMTLQNTDRTQGVTMLHDTQWGIINNDIMKQKS